MTTKVKKIFDKPEERMVPISSLVPPLRCGEWITPATEAAMEWIPKDVTGTVFLLEKPLEYVGTIQNNKGGCHTGWQIFGVDSSHFRKATPHDIEAAIASLSANISSLEIARGQFRDVLKDMKQDRWR